MEVMEAHPKEAAMEEARVDTARHLVVCDDSINIFQHCNSIINTGPPPYGGAPGGHGGHGGHAGPGGFAAAQGPPPGADPKSAVDYRFCNYTLTFATSLDSGDSSQQSLVQMDTSKPTSFVSSLMYLALSILLNLIIRERPHQWRLDR